MAYGCRDVAIILRHPKFKKVTEYNTFHYERKKVLEPMLVLENTRKDKSNHEVLGFWKRSFRLGDVIIVFDVIGCLYSLRIRNNQNVLVLQDTPQPVA